MNILVVSNYFPEHIGGEEIVAFNLVKNLRNMGHTVHWLAGNVPGIPHKPHPDDLEITIWNVTESMFGFPYPLINPVDIRVLVQQVHWADIIHVHDSLFLINLLIGFLAKCLGKPMVLTQHVSVIPYQEKYKVWLQKTGYKVFAKFLLEGSDQVVCVSEVVKEWCICNFRLKKTVLLIANGVDHTIFYPTDDDERERIRQNLGIRADQRVILFAGRFTEKKGIKIIKIAVEKTPELDWILIGRDGEENPGLWPYRNLFVLPPVSQKELRDYYIAADLLVLPSVGEGFPLVVQEAMMCGTPALISNETARALTGLPVLTVDPDAEKLIRAIQDVTLDLKRLNSFRKVVAPYACSHWNWETTTKQYEQLMLNIITNLLSTNR